jgi:hypothetical protein
MGVTGVNHLSDAGFFFMRQALIEARLMSEKRACDAVYVATLTEELRNIEKKIASFEQTRRSVVDESSTQAPPLPAPEDLPDADWIHQKARELELRLRGVEQAFKDENVSGSNSTTKANTSSRAVPRYPKTAEGAASRTAYTGKSKI